MKKNVLLNPARKGGRKRVCRAPLCSVAAAFYFRAGRIMIQYIRIQNFRSVKDIALELGPLNIVFGLTLR